MLLKLTLIAVFATALAFPAAAAPAVAAKVSRVGTSPAQAITTSGSAPRSLLAVAIIVAIAARQFRLPYTVGLVIVGAIAPLA